MPPALLASTILIGFLMVALAVGWLGEKPARLDPSSATAYLHLDHPETTVIDVLISADHTVALLAVEGPRRWAVVLTVGDRLTSRWASDTKVQASNKGWRIHFTSFGMSPRFVEQDPNAWNEHARA